MGECWKLEGGGQLSAEELGPRIKLGVTCPRRDAGLYKAWVLGRGGELLLGTLSPENGTLALNRTVSRTALAEQGCWPITGGRIALTFPFSREVSSPGRVWRQLDRPGRKLSDSVLSRAAAQWGPMLFLEEGDSFCLAAPLDPLRPFPLSPLFCLARPSEIRGSLHAVFRFDREGKPLRP